MHPKLQQQKELMIKALAQLAIIEETKATGNISELMQQQKEYADIMGNLMGNLLDVAEEHIPCLS